MLTSTQNNTIIPEPQTPDNVTSEMGGETCLAPRERLAEPYCDGDSVVCAADPQRDDFF